MDASECNKSRVPRVRKIALAVSLCCALCTIGLTRVEAQSDPKQPDPNQDALKAWSQAVGTNAPAVVRQADGTTKIEWQLQINSDAYGSRVTTAGNSTTNSSFQSGDHVKNSLGLSFKATDESSNSAAQTNLQAAFLDTNDRAVLGKYRDQVTSFQIGRATANYYLYAGDVAANFSPLSSNLGLRGVMGLLKVGSFSITTHIGTIAESWDALTNRTTLTGAPARTNFLRDVYGAKAEYELTKETKFFVTTQGYTDRVSSLAGQDSSLTSSLRPVETQSTTAGVSYQRDQLQLTAEAGISRFGNKNELKRDGDAALLTAVYRIGNVSLRAGHNNIGPLFASLAAAAAPGVQETYLGADWQASSWASVGADIRGGANRVASTAISEATRSPFTAVNTRAQFSLAKLLEGFAIQLQDTRSQNKTPLGVARDNVNSGIGFQLSRSSWNAGLNIGSSLSKDAGNPMGDSTAKNVQLSVGRQIMSQPAIAVPWSISIGGNISSQTQKITMSGMQTRADNLGLTLSAQMQRSGGNASFNLSSQFGVMTQPMGGPDLKQAQYQLDMAYPLTKSAAIKVQGRHSVRNGGSNTLKTTEQTAGASLVLNF
jgi:hypothetical protein